MWQVQRLKVKTKRWKIKDWIFLGRDCFFTKKMIFYKVWLKLLRVEKSEYMGYFSRFMNPRISSGNVSSFNNVSFIARNNCCFMMKLSEAHEADALNLVKYFSKQNRLSNGNWWFDRIQWRIKRVVPMSVTCFTWDF